MGGFRNIISGMANGAINPLYGTELSRQRHEASQQHQRLGHDTKQQLAEAIYKNAELYGGHGTPVGRQLHAMVPQVTSLPDDGTLDAKISQLAAKQAQLVSQGEQQLAQNHAGVQPIQTPPKPEAPTMANSSPFAKAIGQATQGAFPGSLPGPIGALPATNPLTSPAQGGGSPAATFRPAPNGTAGQPQDPGPVGAPAPSPPAPVQPGPAPQPGGNPGGNATVLSTAAPLGIPPLGAGPNIQPDIDEFNSSGYMSPVMRAMIPGQVSLHQGQQLLHAIQPILDQIGPVTDQSGMPDISKLMRVEAELGALGIKGSNMAPMLLQMLAPQSEPGMTTVAALEANHPGFLAAQGYDLAQLDPNTPVRVQVNKFSRAPVSAQIQSVPTQSKNFAEGPVNFNPRTGKYEPVSGPNGQSLTPISMVPHEGFMQVQQTDGSISLVPVETGKKQVAPIQNTPEGGGAIPPVVPAGRSGGSGGGTTGQIGHGRTVGGRNLPPQDILQLKNAIEVGAHQLWGDPDNPSLRPLSSYAHLADDPGARSRLGKALKLVLDSGGSEGASHIGTSIGPVSFSAGGIGEWLTNQLGVPQAVADQRAKIIRGAIESMRPEEVQYFNSLMNAIPTITGMRRLTGASAFRWSQEGLERELPMIGLAGVTSAATFRQKMAALGDEPLTAIKNLQRTNPTAVDPRLVDLIRSGGGFQAPSQVLPVGVPKLGEQFGGGKVLHVERVQ